MSCIIKTGRVVAIDAENIKVAIDAPSACHDCAAQASCALHEFKKRFLVFSKNSNQEYAVGDVVSINLDSGKGLLAVWLGFGMPLILMIMTIIIAHFCRLSDIMSGICGINILIPYYIGLFLFRRRLEKKFGCRLQKHISEE